MHWARANGCKWDTETCVHAAAKATLRSSSGPAPTATNGMHAEACHAAAGRLETELHM